MTDRAERRRNARKNTIKGAKTGTSFEYDIDAEKESKRIPGRRHVADADPAWLANSLDHLFAELNKLPPARPIDVLMLGCNFYKGLVEHLSAELTDDESDLIWQMAADVFTFAAKSKGKQPQ